MKKDMICIVCPVGCHLTIDTETLKTDNNKCKRGERYAEKELLNPTRMLTSTVKINSVHQRRMPIKTTDAIPKDRLFDLMKMLDDVDLKVPVRIGHKILTNVFDTGVDVVASMSLEQ